MILVDIYLIGILAHAVIFALWQFPEDDIYFGAVLWPFVIAMAVYVKIRDDK